MIQGTVRYLAPMEPIPPKFIRRDSDVQLDLIDDEMVEFWRSVDPRLKLRLFERLSHEVFSRVREVVKRDFPDRDEIWILLETHRRFGNDEFYPVHGGG